MADINLTQAEADALIAMEKHRADEMQWLFPQPGGRLAIPLISPDKRENFMLDITRSQIRLTKATFQNRARQAIVLLRLDLDGPLHRNPNDEEVPCPHLHVYREGYGDKWAIAAGAIPESREPVLDLRSLHEAVQCHCSSRHPAGAVLMIDEIEKLLNDYRDWLRDKTTLREIDGEWVEITTPYLDRHNDTLQFYARRENDGYLLTDDSYTVHDLEASGCNLKTEKRQDLLNMTLKGFGVRLNDDALEIHASPETFPLRKHNLIQAMLAVSDLFYLAKPMVESLFYEDVVAWLDGNEIRYTPKAKFTGTSGYDHLFDFVIPKSRHQPERIIQAINRPTRDTAEAFIHKWSDTREVRSPESRAYAVLNDVEQPIAGGVVDAFRNYRIQPVLWTHRAEVATELAA